jgi:glycosyltransferase 2 family protein
MTIAARAPSHMQIKPARKFIAGSIALIYLFAIACLWQFIDQSTLRSIHALPWTLMAGIIGLSLSNFLLRAARWVVLCRQLDFAVPVTRNVIYYLAGFSLTATPGKAGESIRLWFLKQGHDVTWTRSIPVMVADRLIDMWSVLLLALASIAGFAQYLWQAALPLLLLALVSLPFLHSAFLQPLLKGLYGLRPQWGRPLVHVRRVINAMQELNHWRSIVLALLLSAASWFMSSLALCLLLRHFGIDIDLADAVFVFSFSLVIGAISLTPGGVGGTEAGMVLLLRAIGVDMSTALVVTAISRVASFWLAVAVGAAMMPVARHLAVRR